MSQDPQVENIGPPQTRSRWRKMTRRETSMLLCLALTVGIYFYRTSPLPWHPSKTLEATHHVIYSTAEQWQTQETADALGLLYTAYSNRFGGIASFHRDHPKLKVKLYRDRAEFRRIHRNLGWVEAFYRKPYCQAWTRTCDSAG